MLTAAVALSVALAGCGTLPNGHGWGAEATIAPGWERVRRSAVNAARDPLTWGPLAGAAVFAATHLDREVSDWATDHRPLFGSRHNASDWSDTLSDATALTYVGTGLALPSGADAGTWMVNKGKGFAVGASAYLLTGGVTSALKGVSGRARPHGRGDDSFPSGHASQAGVSATLAALNTDLFRLRPGTRLGLKAGYYTLAAGTGWARIEAGQHFPSDVLAGFALGHFFANFVNSAFLVSNPGNPLSLRLEPLADGVLVGFRTVY